ncbi:DUF6458 family protein [Demequina sp. SO4-13]|uniref:DUF6458 family protein n=1 Tax=Demequina sp. SO4-13 TaxID=3401027 RepID=UPI003AF49502
MAIGSGIFLIALGAIMAFALNESVEAVDLQLVGIILMIAGAIGIIISLILNRQRANTTHREVREQPVDEHRRNIDGQP